MNPRVRVSVIAAGAIVVILLGVLVGKILVGGGSSPTASSTPSPSPSASPSESPSPSPSPSPRPSPSPSVSLAPDAPASSQGAFLTSAEAGQVQSAAPDGIDCKALADAGWAVRQCQAFTFSDTVRKAFVVEHKAPKGGGNEGWRVLVLHYSYSHDNWVRDLSFIDDGGAQATSVNVVSADLTKDGKPELVVGYHLQGAGSYLAYDVVTTLIGSPTVAVHSELSNGHATVAKGVITQYDARYGPQGDCCPVDYAVARIGFNAKGWRNQPLPPAKQAPAGDF